MEQPRFKNILRPDSRLDSSNPENAGAILSLEHEVWKNASDMECAGWAWEETLKYKKLDEDEIGRLLKQNIIKAWQKRASFGGDSVPIDLDKSVQLYENAITLTVMFLEMLEECIELIKHSMSATEIVERLDRLLGVLDAQKDPSPFVISSSEKDKLRKNIQGIVDNDLSTFGGATSPEKVLETQKNKALNIVNQLQELLTKFSKLKRSDIE